MPNDLVPSDGNKAKSFWDRTEGTTGMIVNVVAIGGGGILLVHFLPVIVGLMSNLFYAILFGVGVAGLVYAILDNKIRTLVWFGYKSVIRGLTGLFITIDPIGILENYIDSLKKNLEQMDAQIASSKGQMVKLKRLIDGNADEMNNSLKLADKAKQLGKTGEIVLMTRQAGRLKESNMNLQTLYTKLEVIYRVLTKMYENADILCQDTESEVKTKKMEYEAIKTSYSAMRSAMAVINGDPDKKALFEQSMENLADNIGNKIGDMDRFMETSKKVMDSIDLQNGIFTDDGMKMLDAWEKQSDTLLLNPDEKQAAIEAAYDDKNNLNLEGGGNTNSKKKSKTTKASDSVGSVMDKLL